MLPRESLQRGMASLLRIGLRRSRGLVLLPDPYGRVNSVSQACHQEERAILVDHQALLEAYGRNFPGLVLL